MNYLELISVHIFVKIPYLTNTHIPLNLDKSFTQQRVPTDAISVFLYIKLTRDNRLTACHRKCMLCSLCMCL